MELNQAAKNIIAVLKDIGHWIHYDIREIEDDRIWVKFRFPYDFNLMEYWEALDWTRELESTTKLSHGPTAIVSYREKDISPALQITKHYKNDEFIYEIDLDIYAPQHMSWRLFAHTFEVLKNKITRKKTDPKKIAKLLKKNRGIEV